ncbi:hypothetical protein Tco_0095389 [Tanacetum coccineum]
MNKNRELYNESYVLYDRVMNPLAAQQERKLEKVVAQEEVVTPLLLLPPLTNHPLLILTMMMMMEIAKGPRVQALLPPFVNQSSSLSFQNPPNIDPHLEPFYTRQTEIINRQVHIRDEQRGGLRSIGKGLRNLWRNIKK